MTAAATTTQEASLAALAVMGYRNVGAMRIKRPCEANFFAYFLSSLKESMKPRNFLKAVLQSVKSMIKYFRLAQANFLIKEGSNLIDVEFFWRFITRHGNRLGNGEYSRARQGSWDCPA